MAAENLQDDRLPLHFCFARAHCAHARSRICSVLWLVFRVGISAEKLILADGAMCVSSECVTPLLVPCVYVGANPPVASAMLFETRGDRLATLLMVKFARSAAPTSLIRWFVAAAWCTCAALACVRVFRTQLLYKFTHTHMWTHTRITRVRLM